MVAEWTKRWADLQAEWRYFQEHAIEGLLQHPQCAAPTALLSMEEIINNRPLPLREG